MHLHFPVFDPNIVILVILLVAGLYGLVGGKHRLRLLILSTYVGIVLAEELGGLVRPVVAWLGADQVSWLLLGLPIVVFGFTRHRGRAHEPKGSAIANMLVGLLTGALILSSGLHLLAPSEQNNLAGASYLAMLLGQYHLWLLGLLPVVAVLFGLMKGKGGSRH